MSIIINFANIDQKTKNWKSCNFLTLRKNEFKVTINQNEVVILELHKIL